MSPIVLVATAIALVSIGIVSMSSLAAQQAISNANVERTTLEQDRIAEQTNAFISAVSPSSPSSASSNTTATTIVTIKNTGMNKVSIDHCLILSSPLAQSSYSNTTPTTKPTAIVVPFDTSTSAVVVIAPGSTQSLTFSGVVSADNIKCVTSKGTLLPVKLDSSNDNTTSYSVTDDLAIYSVTAKVTPSTASFQNNVAYKPTGAPISDYSTTPAGSLVWSVPVISQITVTQVLRYDASGKGQGVVDDISSGLTGTYPANSNIQIPIAGPTSKVVINYYTNSAATGGTIQQQHSANIYSQTISKIEGSSSALYASAANGLLASYEYASCQGCFQYPFTYVYGNSNNGYVVGMTISNYYCSYYTCQDPTLLTIYSQDYRRDTLSSRDYNYYYNYFTATTSPQAESVFSFPAPASSFTVSLSYSKDSSVSGSASQNGQVAANTYTGVYASNGYSQDNILPGSINLIWNPNSFRSFSGSEHRDGTYQFRIENVQPGQQIQVRVVHGISAALNNPACNYYNYMGTYCDSIQPNISSSTTLTLSP